MTKQTRTEFSINDALAMYRRLREKGQTNTLARLSVEARLKPNERRTVRQLLNQAEPK